jgi:transcriptional regulator with XRE-family HTH domain
MYNIIFVENVLRMLDAEGMTKQELSGISHMSTSFMSDLTRGKANPSLRIMQNIAQALNVPLPLLLEKSPLHSLPPNHERVTAVLPSHQAFIVKKWDAAARRKFGKSKINT